MSLSLKKVLVCAHESFALPLVLQYMFRIRWVSQQGCLTILKPSKLSFLLVGVSGRSWYTTGPPVPCSTGKPANHLVSYYYKAKRKPIACRSSSFLLYFVSMDISEAGCNIDKKKTPGQRTSPGKRRWMKAKAILHSCILQFSLQVICPATIQYSPVIQSVLWSSFPRRHHASTARRPKWHRPS